MESSWRGCGSPHLGFVSLRFGLDVQANLMSWEKDARRRWGWDQGALSLDGSSQVDQR